MTPTPTTITVSGQVIDHTSSGFQPRSGVPLKLQSADGPSWHATSDDAGRFEFGGLPTGLYFWIGPTLESEYRSPCPPGRAPLREDARIDVPVVSTKLLATSGAPSWMPIYGVYVSGMIFEIAQDGQVPVAGAAVTLGAPDSTNAGPLRPSTISDASGHYLVCTVPPETGSDTQQELQVTRDGFLPASRAVFIGWDYVGINVRITRQ